MGLPWGWGIKHPETNEPRRGPAAPQLDMGAEAEQGERLKSQTVKEAPGHRTERVGFREERERGSATVGRLQKPLGVVSLKSQVM